MATSKKATGSAVLAYLEKQLERSGEPVSDAHAERSQNLTDDAIELRHPWSAPPNAPDKIMAVFQAAVDLDPRNFYAMTMLARMAEAPNRAKAHLFAQIAARASRLIPDRNDGVSENWSVGNRLERIHISTLVSCALGLDAAEHYDAANRIRLAGLRLDKRDGCGFRLPITAHALMVGDVKTAGKWLSWASKHHQVREFWCWAEVLQQRLLGNVSDTRFLNLALDCEPLIPHLIVNERLNPDDFSYVAIEARSAQEQHYHASLLQRAWLSHPEDFGWLCSVAQKKPR